MNIYGILSIIIYKKIERSDAIIGHSSFLIGLKSVKNAGQHPQPLKVDDRF